MMKKIYDPELKKDVWVDEGYAIGKVTSWAEREMRKNAMETVVNNTLSMSNKRRKKYLKAIKERNLGKSVFSSNDR